MRSIRPPVGGNLTHVFLDELERLGSLSVCVARLVAHCVVDRRMQNVALWSISDLTLLVEISKQGAHHDVASPQMALETSQVRTVVTSFKFCGVRLSWLLWIPPSRTVKVTEAGNKSLVARALGCSTSELS